MFRPANQRNVFMKHVVHHRSVFRESRLCSAALHYEPRRTAALRSALLRLAAIRNAHQHNVFTEQPEATVALCSASRCCASQVRAPLLNATTTNQQFPAPQRAARQLAAEQRNVARLNAASTNHTIRARPCTALLRSARRRFSMRLPASHLSAMSFTKHKPVAPLCLARLRGTP
jgi:hypothetical protein